MGAFAETTWQRPANPALPTTNARNGFPRLCGILVALLGVSVMVAWHLHWTSVLQFFPRQPYMKFNAAMGFGLSGLGLMVLGRGWLKAAGYWGTCAWLLGSLSLLEYFFTNDPGLDQFFLRAPQDIGNGLPGRMAPLTAASLAMCGGALVAASAGRPVRWRVLATSLPAAVVVTISSTVLCGYIFGVEAATGWGSYARMAVNAAMGLLLLGLGLMSWSNDAARSLRMTFLHWLPVTAAFTLVLMIGVTTVANYSSMDSNKYWQRHTMKVIDTAQVLLGNLTDTQRGMRGFILSSQPEARALYQAAVDSIPSQLNELEMLVQDNPTQELKAQELSAAAKNVIDYSHRLLAARDAQGIPAAIEIESNGEGLAVMNRARMLLSAFTDEERRLLQLRSGAFDTSFRETEHLDIFGGALAAALLLLSTLLASREANFRRSAETKLQVVATFQEAILDSANYGIISTTTSGIVTTFNKTAERWLGYAAREIVGKTTPAVWHVKKEIADRAAVLTLELGRKIEPGFEVFIAKTSPGSMDESEWTLVRRDGSTFPVSISVSALTNPAGEIDGYLGVVGDITDRKKAQEALRRSEERFRQIVENVKDYALFRLDPSGRVESWNSGAERLKGYKSEEIIGKHFSLFYPPEAIKEGHPQKELAIAASEGRYQEEGWRVRKDGSRFLANVSISSIYNEKRELVGYTKVTRDITEQKRFQEQILRMNEDLERRVDLRTRELSESERRLRFLAETMPQIIWTATPDGNVDYYNQRWFEYTGLTLEQTKDWGWKPVIHPEDLQNCVERWTQAFQSGNNYEVEYRFLRASDQTYRWHLGRAFALRGDGGQIVQWVGTCTDVDELKQVEDKVRKINEGLEKRVWERTEELNAKNIELEKAARAKNIFLANMSHELRTPLNGIIGFSELMIDGIAGPVNADQKEYLNDVLNSGQHLLQLINDVLDLAKVEAGKMELHLETFPISQMIDQVCSVISPLVQKKKIALTRQLDPAIDQVTLDAQRIKQVLFNLLSNAIKFTDEHGRVGIRVDRAGEDQFTIAVQDSGIGIKPENLGRLFQEFEQLEEGTTRRYQGTGLGLALTRKIITMHHGSIDVQSEFGKGTTFTVKFPVKCRETSA